MSNVNHLKENGLKVTGPRLRILQLFEQAEVRHLSAAEIHQRIHAEEASIGLATVYRVLTQFEEAGLLIRHHFESGKAVYELKETGHHDHMLCVTCGKVIEFFCPELEALQEKIAADYGFHIQEHRLCLFGRCVDCAHTGASSPA